MKILKTIFLILSSLLFILSVFCLNSEGTTWGNSISFIGLLLVFPTFFGILKIRLDNFSKWLNFCIGLVAISYTTFCYLDAQKKIYASRLSETTYWAPDSGFQLLVIILSLFLVSPVLIAYLKNEKSEHVIDHTSF